MVLNHILRDGDLKFDKLKVHYETAVMLRNNLIYDIAS